MLILAFVLVLGGCRTAPSPQVMAHDVATDAKPWTDKPFHNAPAAFQFAIVSDNTSGMQPGVFASAMEKLNLLQPEFVICVGDLIQGYTTDLAQLNAEKAESDRMINTLSMPFFRIPGNHDTTNLFMSDEWERTYGRRYYSFVYKDVLFLCFDTQGADQVGDKRPAGLGDEQLAWAVETLRKHPDVRWTFVFMHKPLWMIEEDWVARKKVEPGYTRFGELEAALADRDYTLFCGHFHNYRKYVRNGRNYFLLATTGGGHDPADPKAGYFDEIAWVTMTPEGPRLANLLLDGILDENVFTEKEYAFVEPMRYDAPKWNEDGSVSLIVPVTNTFDAPVDCRFSWIMPKGTTWTVSPSDAADVLDPGEKMEWTFTATCAGDIEPRPTLRGEFIIGGKTAAVAYRDVPVKK
jgi:hypothetical protein